MLSLHPSYSHSSHLGTRIVLILAVALLVLGLALSPPPAFARNSALALPRLPHDLPSHFSFGIMDGHGGASYLNSMRAQNGTAWDYRYNYLAGGVNTGHGWATWNSPAGQYAVYFMQDNQANTYQTAFVYYMLLQSNGPSGGDEMHTDLAHLADASLMHAYYDDWALLMQKIGADRAPVLVLVEPDLWGYIEQAAVLNGSNSAATIPASVASSGAPDAQGFPDTAQGFAWALLHLRDRYAPHALLALHASAWGTRQDIASSTDPHLDVTTLGTQEGHFLQTAGLAGNPNGLSTFDLISNDIADHDAGQSGIWWDEHDVTFPNFARYLQFIQALRTSAGRRIIMWQVPVGNQYFTTENNSQGHTQDNRPDYILKHIPAFVNAGIVGVLFGPGNGGTNVFDNQNDGITNPAPISTYACNFCNNHTSSYADDDGGYLRIFLGQYYRNGAYPLNGAPLIPTPIPTASATAVITATPTPAATAGTSATPGATTTSSPSPKPVSARASSPSSWFPIVLLLGLCVAGAGAGLFWWRRRQTRRSAVAQDDDAAWYPARWDDHPSDDDSAADHSNGAIWDDEEMPTRPLHAKPRRTERS